MADQRSKGEARSPQTCDRRGLQGGGRLPFQWEPTEKSAALLLGCCCCLLPPIFFALRGCPTAEPTSLDHGCPMPPTTPLPRAGDHVGVWVCCYVGETVTGKGRKRQGERERERESHDEGVPKERRVPQNMTSELSPTNCSSAETRAISSARNRGTICQVKAV